jgi:hypothetical protein
MHKLIYRLLLYRTFTTEKIFIKNKNLPICSKCIYFIEHKNNYPYDSLPSDEDYGKCKKFGEVNIITGVTHYDFAKNCRSNDKKCGYIGLEYINKNSKNNIP